MYRQRNKQKYFTLHYCGKVKADAASPGHKNLCKSVKSVGHKKLPQISQIHTDSLSLTQVLHKRNFFLSYLVAKKMQTSAKKACFQFVECSFSSAKKMQTSAMKACFQFAECSFSYAKIRLFLVTSKVLGKKYLKRGRRKRK